MGPDEIASRMPYISMFPPKLCNIHLTNIKTGNDRKECLLDSDKVNSQKLKWGDI